MSRYTASLRAFSRVIANRRLEEKQLHVELTDAAKDFIVSSGYDPVYGARPLKRFVQSHLETLIAKKIIAGGLKPRTTLKVDCDGSDLTIAESAGV